MRCQACNVILTSQEATRRFKESNTFVDLCSKCLTTIEDDVGDVTEGYLGEEEDFDDENFDD